MYNALDYGIIGDGKTNNTKNINLLLEKIKDTGGTVYFPPGEYLTGSILMYGNTTLFIDSGARLSATDNFDEFPYIANDGIEDFNIKRHRGFISSFGCENITICGRGEINGSGRKWWKSGKSDIERPRLIKFIMCKNVQIKDVTLKNSPCWTVHPVCCENVTVNSVTVQNPYDSPNTDGINPESCKNVRISDCHIDVGDDCITIKSGTETDTLQKRFPCENVTVSNCTMSHGHGGVVIGSEMSGGIKNIVISNCVFQNTDRGIRIKTRRERGGYIDGILVGNIIMDKVKAAITVNEFYWCGAPKDSKNLFDEHCMPVTDKTPEISNISINGIIARNVEASGIYMYGLPERNISGITINNADISVTGCREGFESVLAYNRPLSFGEGIFMENVKDTCLNNIKISCGGEKLTVKNCTNVTLNGKNI